MSSQIVERDDEGGEWIFVDRETGEPHEGLDEETIDEWEPVFKAEGRPYEVIEPDNSRRLYDGD